MAPAPRTLTVTVALDGSDASWRALSYALGVSARHSAAHLVVVHVDRRSGVASMNPEWQSYREDARRQLEEALRSRVATELSELGVSWEFCVRQGGWDAQVREVAQAVRADLVVVGARSRCGWGRRRLASALIAEASWPVIAVP